jgi:hypothetical protein
MEYLGLGERIILGRMSEKQVANTRTEFIRIRIKTGPCEHSNEIQLQ